MEKRYTTRDIPTLYARAVIDPKSIDIENRTVWVTFATDKPVRMWSYEKGSHLEELDMNEGSVRMDRINIAGAVWDNHQYGGGQRGVLGKVVPGTATLEQGQGRAQLRFSKKPIAEEAWQDVQDQIVTTVSVGYDVYEAGIVRTEGTTKVYRATDWEPFEISLAPMPADISAQMRSAQTHPAQFEDEQEPDFSDDRAYAQSIRIKYQHG